MAKQHATSTHHLESELYEEGWTDLHDTCAEGDLAAAETALAAGHAVDAVWGKYDRQPMHSACQEGHLPLAKLLVEHGADVRAEDSDGWLQPSPRRGVVGARDGRQA